MKITKRAISIVLALILSISCLTICVFADEPIKSGVAFVDATALRLRSGPSTGASVVDTAYDEEVVVVLEKSGEWYKVIYNLQEGYMHQAYLDISSTENVELGYGEINAYCVNLRSKPSTSSSIVTQAYEGAKAYILGINEGWYKVIYKDQTCYVRSDLLDLTEIPYENRDSENDPKYFRGGEAIGAVPGPSEEEEPVEETPAVPAPSVPSETAFTGTAVVKASALHLREKASTGSKSLAMAYRNETVDVTAKAGDWFKVKYNGKVGYMHGDYLTVTESISEGQKIVNCAEQYLGVPYVWGGSSPNGFDCSGFVQYVTRKCGYSIGRTVTQQWNYGTQVSKEDLQPGDLVFFVNTYTSGFSHIGIYVGDGEFIHASSNGGVKYSDLNSNYYTQHYYSARRLG